MERVASGATMDLPLPTAATGPVPPCPICGAYASIKGRAVPGYQEPATFTVAECGTCAVQWVLDTAGLDPDPIYERIYAQVEHIPAYARYHRHGREVLRAADPLGYLAEAEDMYWSVQRYFAARPDATTLRVIEIGSGIGYLTYALARRGVPTRGVDISSTAVERARAVYGDLYECADVADLADRQGERYDVVVMTETIEHVKDPVAIIAALDQLLAPGGEIVITTPNRDYHKAGALWATELPPVHLWWFSEGSLRMLARRLGFGVRFVDFAAYNRKHYWPPPPETPGRPGRPTLDKDGRVRARAETTSGSRPGLRAVARALRVGPRILTARARLMTAVTGPRRARAVTGAVFYRPLAEGSGEGLPG